MSNFHKIPGKYHTPLVFNKNYFVGHVTNTIVAPTLL